MDGKSKARAILGLCLLGWLLAVGGGSAAMWHYAAAAGADATAPAQWPATTQLSRHSPFTLLTFVHPHCPCSRASVGELDRLMAHMHGTTEATVLFVRPPEFSADWAQSDLWRSAGAIPGVKVMMDDGGREAAVFGARTSGQVMLYDADGRLQFSGGITAARGHAGDNAGSDAILACISAEKPLVKHTPVYGCGLGETNGVCLRGEACH